MIKIVLAACLIAIACETTPSPIPETTLEPSPEPEDDCLFIHEIQGNQQKSGLVGVDVCAKGVVSAVVSDGFYMQTPDDRADNDINTSEGMFVFTDSAPENSDDQLVQVGDAVRAFDKVGEFYPGGNNTGNLPQTNFALPRDIFTLPLETVFPGSDGVITPVVLGKSGRIPPVQVFYPNTLNVVECVVESTCPVMDQANGIDFYEAIEGMLVTLEDPVVVGPTNRFSETFVVVNRGQFTTGMNNFSGITIDPFVDFNPERVQIQGGEFDANMGAVLSGVTGVIDYEFGNFQLNPTTNISVSNSSPAPGSFSASGLTIATYNILNFAAEDISQAALLASQIVNNLNSPAILALQEVQDNSGEDNNGVVDASETLQVLVDTIASAGGPTYNHTTIDPLNNEDGGVPGGNIRNAFLYDTSKVSLAPSGNAAAGNATDNAAVSGAGLNFNPVRITGSAFDGSRKPVVAHFLLADSGDDLFLVNVHFSSKGGSTPLMGAIQPSENGGVDKRASQANAVNEFITSLQSEFPDAMIAVLGDINEFTPFPAFPSFPDWDSGDGPLSDLLLDSDDAWTYVFRGNSQALDHVFANAQLESRVSEIKVIHVNSVFSNSQQVSDHDPIVFALTNAP